MKTNFLFFPAWWFSVITLPTHITLIRLLLVPFIVLALLAQNLLLAVPLFIAAALTDIIDGALARSLHAESELGATLDPLADKALLISCYACLTYNYFPFNMIPAWFLITVVFNECILVGGSLYLGLLRNGIAIKPTRLGKVASFVQILFIGWLFMCGGAHTVPLGLFYCMLTLILCVRATVLLQYSSILYYKGT